MTMEKKRGGLVKKGKVSKPTYYKVTGRKSYLERKADSKKMYDMSLEGKSHDEIAEKFGFAPVTIQRRIAEFREEHDLPMPKARGRKALPKKVEIKQPLISYDYDKVRRRLINSRTIFNVDGIHQAEQTLKCLEICPFIDVVSEFLGGSRFDGYGKLKYYLTEDEYQKLLKVLKDRRKSISKSDCKQDLESKITKPVKKVSKKVVRPKRVKKVKEHLSPEQKKQIKFAEGRIRLAYDGHFTTDRKEVKRIVKECKDEIKQVRKGKKVKPITYKHLGDKRLY